jgi:DnaJ-class molecular chaperone
MKRFGLEIPPSFREACGCCEGRGQHDGCALLPRRCDACEGTGWVLNQLGQDLYRVLMEGSGLEARIAAWQEAMGVS